MGTAGRLCSIQRLMAEWATLMGPVEFDVYDSDFPICYSWGKASERRW